LKPVRKRKLVDEMRDDWDVSIRRHKMVMHVDQGGFEKSSAGASAGCGASDDRSGRGKQTAQFPPQPKP
jgi:hypothetical protein